MAVPDKKMLEILSPLIFNENFSKYLQKMHEDMMKVVLIPSRQLGKSYAYGGTVAKSVPKIESAGVRLGEAEAWRLWRVDGHNLKSIVRDVTWLPGVPMTGDPKPTNTAGVYAFRDPADAYRELDPYTRARGEPSVVLGTVKLWGRYVEHERGYRAEFARITSLEAGSRHDPYLGSLRDLYLNHRCPAELTPGRRSGGARRRGDDGSAVAAPAEDVESVVRTVRRGLAVPDNGLRAVVGRELRQSDEPTEDDDQLPAPPLARTVAAAGAWAGSNMAPRLAAVARRGRRWLTERSARASGYL